MTLPLTEADPVRIGDYEILARLGTGGQGVVYLGRPRSGAGQVAIKLLHARMVEDAGARARFVRELTLLRRVAGFCTAQMLEADMQGDRPYIVSEYVPGPSLRDLVLGRGPRTGADLDRLAISSVTALTAIHRAGIVHRDFKPQNVLMGPDGPRVIDFGIARALEPGATVTSQIVGTPAYMAPEQFAGAEISSAADLFSWAATLLFAATGEDAFAGGPLSAVMYRIMNHTPDTSVLPAQIGEVADACLQKDPAARPSAETALLRLLGERPGQGPVTPVVPGTPSPHTPESTDIDPKTGVPRQVRRTSPPGGGAGTGTAPFPAVRGPDTADPAPAVPGQRRDRRGDRRDAPGGAGPPAADRPAPSAGGSPHDRNGTAGHPFGRDGPGGLPPPGPPPPEGASPDAPAEAWDRPAAQPAVRPVGWNAGWDTGQATEQDTDRDGGGAARPSTKTDRPRTRRERKAAKAAGRARDGPAPARRASRLPRTAPVVAGLLIAGLLAVLDVASLALLVARPDLTRGPNGGWLLALGGAFVILAVITLAGVVLAFRGSRAAAWTVMAVRVLRVPLWGALSGIVVIRPADLALYAAVTALVVVLLTMGLRAPSRRPPSLRR